MKKVACIIILVVLASIAYSQSYCLKVVKCNKKEYVIMPGQKIRMYALDQKGRVRFVTHYLTEVNDREIVIVPANRDKYPTQRISVLHSIEAIGFKTPGSITSGITLSIVSAVPAILTGNGIVILNSIYKNVLIKEDKWGVEIDNLSDYMDLSRDRLTAKRIRIKDE